MRKISKLGIYAISFLLAGFISSCAKEGANLLKENNAVIFAGINNPGTRVALVEDGTVLKTYWKDAADAEKFSIHYTGAAAQNYLFVKNQETSSSATASFACAQAPELAAGTVYAVYPGVEENLANTLEIPFVLGKQPGTQASVSSTNDIGDYNFMVANLEISANGGLDGVSAKFMNKVSILKLALTFPAGTEGKVSSLSVSADGMHNAGSYDLKNGVWKFTSSQQGAITAAPATALDASRTATFYLAIFPEAITLGTVTAKVGGSIYTAKLPNFTASADKMYSVKKNMTFESNIYEWYTNNPAAESFTISNADELVALANIVNGKDKEGSGLTDTVGFFTKTVTLANDIDLSTVCGANTNSWDPIGWYESDDSFAAFTGTFDGNGKTISNLYINNTLNNRGLFGLMMYGNILNLNLTNAYVSGGNNVGALCGRTNSAQKKPRNYIKYCSIDGTVKASGETPVAGGYVGYAQFYTEFHGCSGNVEVSTEASKAYVGGFVGRLGFQGRIIGCANKANVSAGQDSYVGGFVGWTASGGYTSVNATYMVGTVTAAGTGSKNLGALVGFNNYNDAVGSNAYYVDYGYTGVGTNRATNQSASLGTAVPADWTNVGGKDVIDSMNYYLEDYFWPRPFEFRSNGTELPIIVVLPPSGE